MARHDGDFRPGDGKPLEIAELLELLDRKASAEQPAVVDARACYLSSSDGWREAVRQIGGAFADDIDSLGQEQEE